MRATVEKMSDAERTDKLDALLKRDGHKPATQGLLFSTIKGVLRGFSEGLRQGVSKDVDNLQSALDLLTARVEAIETRALEYLGTYQAGKSYRPGSAVTWSGSLWIALRATDAKPGEAHEASRAWRLAVKKGTDGKDGRP